MRSITWLETRAGNQRTCSRAVFRSSEAQTGAAAMTSILLKSRPASFAPSRTKPRHQSIRSGSANWRITPSPMRPDELCPASKLRQSICLGDPPSGSVRDADVENLALANQVVQTAHDFFHWCDPIPDVHPVQVDVVGLQSFQTVFYCLHHALAS